MEADLKNNLESAFSTYDTHARVDTLWTTLRTPAFKLATYKNTFHQSCHHRGIVNPGITDPSVGNPGVQSVHRARRTGRQKDWDIYRHKQNETQKACKSACNTYINVNNNTGNKKLYSYIKSRRCESNGVSPLMKDETLHGDSKTKAELLNSQFSSGFTTEDKRPKLSC